MELRDYIRILRKSWLIIALLVLVSIAAATAYSITRTPEYSASAKVFVSTQFGESGSDLVQGNSFTQARVKTYASLVDTPAVLLPVIARLQLDLVWQDLEPDVSATSPLDTAIIEITVMNEDPAVAANVANAVGAALTAVVADIETTAGSTESPVKLTRVQDAAVPLEPVSPNVPLNIALGALVGLALGLGLAVLREVLDTRVRNERDIEMLTDVPIVGGIGFDPKASS